MKINLRKVKLFEPSVYTYKRWTLMPRQEIRYYGFSPKINITYINSVPLFIINGEQAGEII